MLSVLAPTGVAVLNIDGSFIHAGFRINPNSKRYSMGELHNVLKAKLSLEYSETEVQTYKTIKSKKYR